MPRSNAAVCEHLGSAVTGHDLTGLVRPATREFRRFGAVTLPALAAALLVGCSTSNEVADISVSREAPADRFQAARPATMLSDSHVAAAEVGSHRLVGRWLSRAEAAPIANGAPVVLTAAPAPTPTAPAPTAPAPTAPAPATPAPDPTAPPAPDAPAAPAEKRLFRWALGSVSPEADKFFSDTGLDFKGYVQQGFTGNVGSPSDRTNVGRVYDDRSNDYRFHGLFHEVSRSMGADTAFDAGFKYSGLFGTDARFNHSKGLLDKQNNLFQYDIWEMYGEVRLPVGNGPVIKVGKFATYCGYEVLDPNANDFYSRSYTYNYGPFTHTGAVASYTLFKHEDGLTLLELRGGVLMGWDTFRDDNGGVTGYAGLTFNPTSTLSIGANFLFGPEKEGVKGDMRNFLDLVIVYTGIEKLKLAANIDFGVEADGRAAGGGGEAWWNTMALYASYNIGDLLGNREDSLKIAGRFEWFNDYDGNRLGNPGQYFSWTLAFPFNPTIYTGGDYYLAPIQIIPELRYDYFAGGGRVGSDNRPFQAGTLAHQFTLGISATVRF